MRTFRVFAVVCLLVPCRALPAQGATLTNWQAVQALPLHLRVQVKADTRKSDCHITSVTDDKLTCAEASFARSEIKSIKLTNKTRSILGSFGAGMAIGAGAGAIAFGAPDPGSPNSWFYVSRGEAAAIGAGLGSAVGGITGAIVGASGNRFSKTIYKR